MFNGIINVYKEKGYTSHDVVAKMRGILKMKKIGHTGTLDPDAIGVLPVCVGKGTKLVDLITDKDKTYETVLKLGITTDTQDLTGEILNVQEVKVTPEQIEAVILNFIGEYLQLPPMYSAIKVEGKRLYELARQGKEVERNRRNVYISDIQILNYNLAENEVTMRVDCGKGTYIRTLLHDIGEELGCGGAMKSLVRTRVGGFKLENALTLAQISELMQQQELEPNILPLDSLFTRYPKVIINREFHKLIYNGNSFLKSHILSSETVALLDFVRVYDADDVFIGIYQLQMREGEYFKPIKMFI